MTGRTTNAPGFMSFRGLSVIAFGGLYQIAISLLSGIIIARTLGPSAYGLFNLARTWCETAVLITKSGYDIGVVRYIGEQQAQPSPINRGAVLKRVLLIVTVLSVVPFIWLLGGGARWVNEAFYGVPRLESLLWVLGASIPLTALLQTLAGMARGGAMVVPGMLASLIVQPTVRLALVIAFIPLGTGVFGVAVATSLSFAVALAYLWHKVRIPLLTQPATFNESTPGSWRQAFDIGRYAVVIAATIFVAGLLNRVDILILGHYVSATELGLYAAAQMIVVMVSLVNGALNQLIAPRIATMHKIGDTQGLRATLHRHTRWVIYGTLPIFGATSLFGDYAAVLFGRDYHLPWQVLLLLGITHLFVAILSSSGYLLSMTGHHTRELVSMLTGLVLTLILALWLIPSHGLIGAAASTMIGMVLANIVRAGQVYRIHRIVPIATRDFYLLLIGLCALVPAIAAKAAGMPGFTVAVAFALYLAFFISIVVTATARGDDFVLLRNLLSRLNAANSQP